MKRVILMVKAKRLLVFALVIASGFFAYYMDIQLKKSQNRQAIVQKADEKAYLEAVAKVDDAAVIKKALKAVGVLSVLEGEEAYQQIIEEENWYSYRGIQIDWRYRFAIAMNLEDVGIQVQDALVLVTIAREKLFIQYVEKTSDSTSHSDASWLAEQFNSQEIEALEKAVLQKVKDQIEGSPLYWDAAVKSLEDNIRKICVDLQYDDVRFIQ